MHLLKSLTTYPLHKDDVLALPVAAASMHKPYPAILLGNNKTMEADRLLCDSGLERGERSRENAYALTRLADPLSETERINIYNNLEDSMLKHGWNPANPATVMLCRRLGIRDSLDDGHHRLGIALLHNIKPASIRFAYASQLPFVSCFSSRPLRTQMRKNNDT